MTVGTKSVLFGVHQFIWHPATVVLAWRRLYGRWPGLYEFIAIACHDLGYIGCTDMDGPSGRRHPVRGAVIAAGIVRVISTAYLFFSWVWFDFRSGSEYAFRHRFRQARDAAGNVARSVFWLSLLHSSHTAEKWGAPPSALCWADKASIFYEPAWFYIFRAKLSGELWEVIHNAPPELEALPPVFWFNWYRRRVQTKIYLKLGLYSNDD